MLIAILDSTSCPWASPLPLGLIATAIIALGGIRLTPSATRASRSCRCISSRTSFTVTAARRLIVGFALFGSVTYFPLSFQRRSGRAHGIRPADAADDARHAHALDRLRPADQPHGALQDLPGRGHRGDDPGPVAPSRTSTSHDPTHRIAAPDGARHRARHGDAGARARRAERRGLSRSRRRHLGRHPSSVSSAARSARPSSARSSPLAWPRSCGARSLVALHPDRRGRRPAHRPPGGGDARGRSRRLPTGLRPTRSRPCSSWPRRGAARLRAHLLLPERHLRATAATSPSGSTTHSPRPRTPTRSPSSSARSSAARRRRAAPGLRREAGRARADHVSPGAAGRSCASKRTGCAETRARPPKKACRPIASPPGRRGASQTGPDRGRGRRRG